MKVELNRKDLENLIRGTDPSYEMMSNHIVKRCGSYCGGFNDRWDWNYTIPSDITDVKLYETYLLLRDGSL